MTRNIKVGLIQMKCDQQVEVNFNKTIDYIKQAVKAGAQIVCTQELFKSPYFPQTVNKDFYTLGEDVHENSATVQVLSDLANELDVVIIASLFEKRAIGLYHNTAVVINAGGQYLGKYRKMHIPDESILASVPVQLPALMRAYRLSERAAGVGFDWPDISGVMEKVQEEWEELQQAAADNDHKQVAAEFGDLLFTLVNLARFARIHPETALTSSIKKFERRFRQMENIAAEQGRDVGNMSPAEMDAIWNAIKRDES